ncbi:hypothetical protein QYE76_055033 [Lolium multiflorum]|uniref:Uncharacterized protein n=1 Tax=Lolium multiflorum TaxID=4521 RepID=A0AAD8SZF6_LOLMU|nr:hypothetical protein QYE76_055033 [Lolium multiflorum]
MGKDRLPAPDPVGDRCSEEHFMRLRAAVKELDSAWSPLMLGRPFSRSFCGSTELAEAHDKCQGEKDQLNRQHQEELNALKTSYQELKSQLIQLGLDHAKALKAK